MRHLNGYGAYLLFIALRAHFENDKYDYFTMNGKTRATKESFHSRNDRAYFDKLAKRYSDSELRDFFVANFIEGRMYATDLLDQPANDTYIDYIQRRQSISYTFRNDLEKVFSKGVNEVFKTRKNEYPFLLTLYLRKEITLETLIILNDLAPFEEKFNKFLGKNDILWGEISLSIRKYKPFLHYNKDKISKTLKEVLNEQRQETEAFSTKESSYTEAIRNL